MLPETLQQSQIFKQSVRDKILNGEVPPLEFFMQAKLISDVVDELKRDSEVKACASEELAKYGKEKAMYKGSLFSQGSKTTYDYSTCNDSRWNELKEEISRREKFLKTIPPEGVAIPETGELILPPKASVSTFITVKL